MTRREGNAPYLDIVEHNEVARAKRALMVGLDSAGSDYRSPSVFDYTDSDPISVVLVHPVTGAAYSATAGGGTSPSTTMYSISGISTSTTLYSVVDVSASVTLDAFVNVSTAATLYSVVDVSASVTLDAFVNVSTAATLYSVVDVASSVTLDAFVNVSTAATLNAVVGVSESVTVYSMIQPVVTARMSQVGDYGTASALVPAGSTVQLLNLGVPEHGYMFSASRSNLDPIYIGNSTVTSSPTATNACGFELWPGDAVTIEIRNSALLYATAPTNDDQIVTYMRV